MKPSLLASEPSLTYTLIGPWCMSMSKTLLITFLELLFLKNCVVTGGLWQALSFSLNWFMAFIFSLLLAWATCGGGHHYWIIFSHVVGWPFRRSFICFGPFSNSFRDHHMGPQLHLSILSRWYPHHGAFEWDYLCFWPSFDLISLSWA
jgi:hypothetical protein